MFLPKDVFSTVIESTPLVSIDLVIKSKQGQCLLGYRTNRPACGFWFVPGGRILKGERVDTAFSRLVKAELGVDMTMSQAKSLGVYDHFYDDYVFGEGISTHYVVLAYEIEVDIKVDALPTSQHSNYKWFDVETLLADESVHCHSKWYFNKASY
ncbi:GDP-mannose mannosyl hydrolase [Thalassotalea maritima]|uniref:GDP-mannose mannosyl hydrolase n=1 Tax=Thalassotalea maritima TaxID=3242416 RepID=UPI00352904E5